VNTLTALEKAAARANTTVRVMPQPCSLRHLATHARLLPDSGGRTRTEFDLTQAQANALKQHIQQGDRAPFFGAHGFRHRGVRGTAAVAGYLGLSRTTLRSELQSGKSLAQIAASTPGKSVAGLKAAIVAAGKARLEQAVSSGRITAAQEQQWLAALPARIDALLQRTGHPGSHRGEGLGPFGH